MKRTPVFWILILSALLVFTSTGADARHPRHGTSQAITATKPNQAGVFDYYLLTLSWSPTYCLTHKSDKEQCAGKGYGFVLHGLWPQYLAGGYPQNCPTDAPLTKEADSFGKTIFPSEKLVDHEWSKHGTCSGLDALAYFKVADQARTDLKVPAMLESPAKPLSVSANEIIAAFTAENPGMTSNSLVVACSGPELQEIRVCLNRKMETIDCGKGVTSSCGNRPIRVPSVR